MSITWPAGVELSEFRPLAYFDKHMDCIRVITHDCSTTEHRINEFYTLFEANNRSDFIPRYTGFTMKGVRSAFEQMNLPLEGVYTLAELYDLVVQRMPGSVMAATASLIFRDYANCADLSINLAA